MANKIDNIVKAYAVRFGQNQNGTGSTPYYKKITDKRAPHQVESFETPALWIYQGTFDIPEEIDRNQSYEFSLDVTVLGRHKCAEADDLLEKGAELQSNILDDLIGWKSKFRASADPTYIGDWVTGISIMPQLVEPTLNEEEKTVEVSILTRVYFMNSFQNFVD